MFDDETLLDDEWDNNSHAYEPWENDRTQVSEWFIQFIHSLLIVCRLLIQIERLKRMGFLSAKQGEDSWGINDDDEDKEVS